NTSLYSDTMRTIIFVGILLSLSLSAAAQSVVTHIRNVTIVDGTGKKRFAGDVTIVGKTIARIGKPNSVKPRPSDTTIDGTGLVLAPGFIDIHNHSESGLLRDRTAATQVSQGLTTIIVGPDGGSPASL